MACARLWIAVLGTTMAVAAASGAAADIVVELKDLPQRAVRPVPAPAPTAPEAKPAEEEPAAPPKSEPVDPHIVRLHMADGTIMSGKLSITDLAIDTKFGRLTVPITMIRYVKPGLESRAKLREKADQWITALGADSPDERKAAGAELTKLGPQVLDMLRGAIDGAGPQKTAELKSIIERISETIDPEYDDPAETTTLDVVATTAFTITGKIVPQSFELSSDFGTLTMPLESLVKADRDTGEPEEERKTVVVNENNFIHKGLKSSGLRVVKGDKVIIRAGGQITMTRWGNTMATPEGAANTGWYQSGKIYNGALVYRIGNGAIQKAGANNTFTATESGVLHFGIAMNPRFGVNDGFRYPGEFKVDVRVKKK